MTRQNSTNNQANNLILSGSLITAPVSAQSLAATSTINISNRIATQVSSSTHIEITTASPIPAGTEGQQIILFNSGNFSIYLQSLSLGLKPQTSAILIYLNSAWQIIAAPPRALIWGHNELFIFANGAKAQINDDYTISIYNSSGSMQAQETAIIGAKIDYNRGFILPDNNTWNRPAGYYKYALGANNIILPAVTSNLAEYKCF